jgi:hypothetical protein
MRAASSNTVNSPRRRQRQRWERRERGWRVKWGSVQFVFVGLLVSTYSDVGKNYAAKIDANKTIPSRYFYSIFVPYQQHAGCLAARSEVFLFI